MKKKLIILPYAGSTVRDMGVFIEHLKNEIDVEIVEYAGHGSRGREKLYASWTDMESDVAAKINSMVSKGENCALMGYSMGSLLLYELLAKNSLHCAISHVFLCAHTPRDNPRESDFYYTLTDEEFLKKMQAMGGMKKVEESMIGNRIFQKLYFMPIRNDFRLIGEYAAKTKEKYPLLTQEISVIYSPNDTPEEQIDKWDTLFEKESEKISMGTDHFFIWEKGKELAQYIVNILEKKVSV